MERGKGIKRPLWSNTHYGFRRRWSGLKGKKLFPPLTIIIGNTFAFPNEGEGSALTRVGSFIITTPLPLLQKTNLYQKLLTVNYRQDHATSKIFRQEEQPQMTLLVD